MLSLQNFEVDLACKAFEVDFYLHHAQGRAKCGSAGVKVVFASRHKSNCSKYNWEGKKKNLKSSFKASCEPVDVSRKIIVSTA